MSSCEPSFFKPCGHVLVISLAGSSSATGKQGTCLSSFSALVSAASSLLSAPSFVVCESVLPSELRRSTLTLKSLISCFGKLELCDVLLELDDSNFGIFAGVQESSVIFKSSLFFPNFCSKFWWCFSSSKALFQAVDFFTYRIVLLIRKRNKYFCLNYEIKYCEKKFVVHFWLFYMYIFIFFHIPVSENKCNYF